MAYYDLPKAERAALYQEMSETIQQAVQANSPQRIVAYFDHPDTYIRKNAYLALGRLEQGGALNQTAVIGLLHNFWQHTSPRVRQTVINTAGELGCRDFDRVRSFFDQGLADPHHQVRNAVIGSIKKMSAKNPVPVLAFAAEYLDHEQAEIRREVAHGIELRGRTHPQDILPLLRRLEYDRTARVRNTLIHVLGQIAYKEGCLETVCADLKQYWTNAELIKAALLEIIDVHRRYQQFSWYSQDEAIAYIEEHFK